MTNEAEKDAPVYIDRVRMDRALAGPSFMFPSCGLSVEQIGAVMTAMCEAIGKADAYAREMALKEAAAICDEHASMYAGAVETAKTSDGAKAFEAMGVGAANCARAILRRAEEKK
jgi:hypothetical protein